jgi:DUF971 family protein
MVVTDMTASEDRTSNGTPQGASPGPGDRSATPRDLTVKLEAQKLFIDWQDGKRSTFDLGTLRGVCPCATCRTERDGQASSPLRILKFDPARSRVTTARLVGQYAIQFTWSDGHDTGIFEFRFLRSLPDQGLPGG